MADNLFTLSDRSSARRQPSRRLNPARLRIAREAKRLNMTELADAVGLTRQSISAFEQGNRQPDGETMATISAVLEQPISYFGVDDPPTFDTSSVRFFRATGVKTKRRNLACDALSDWLVQTANPLCPDCYFKCTIQFFLHRVRHV